MRALPTLLLATALLATACSGGAGSTGDVVQPADDAPSTAAEAGATEEGSGGDGPRVVVTTTILGDLVQELVAEDGVVEVLMQPGQDPHGFSPSARQAASVRDADLVVANGLQLEESLLDVLASAESDGARVLRVAEQLDPEEFAPAGTAEDDHADEDDGHADEEGDDHADEGEGGDDHDHAGPDPHVWYDPVRMADGVVLLAAELAAVDDALDDDEWAARGEELADRILAAHDEVEAVLDGVPDDCRTLVTSHDSFGYFAARYDFEVIGTVVPGTSTQVDPSARDFAALAETLREADVPAIFAETTQPARLAEALAGEVGQDVQVVPLFTDSLGEPGSGADTYTGMLRTNAERIADALADC